MDCLPFSFTGLDIYALGIRNSWSLLILVFMLTPLDSPCSEQTYNAILRRSPRIINADVQLASEGIVHWNINAISSDFAHWMSDEQLEPPSTSRVGILSTWTFERLISSHVDKSLCKYLRLLIGSASILYARGSQASYADCNSTDLRKIRSFAGSKVLQSLETALGNSSLAGASDEKLKALFLVLFGTIVAVGYSKRRGYLDNVSAPCFSMSQNSALISMKESTVGLLSFQDFQGAQQQLLRILTHHMIYIGEKVSLLDRSSPKSHIIEEAYRQWNRKALFEWKDMPGPNSTNNSIHQLQTLDPKLVQQGRINLIVDKATLDHRLRYHLHGERGSSPAEDAWSYVLSRVRTTTSSDQHSSSHEPSNADFRAGSSNELGSDLYKDFGDTLDILVQSPLDYSQAGSTGTWTPMDKGFSGTENETCGASEVKYNFLESPNSDPASTSGSLTYGSDASVTTNCLGPHPPQYPINYPPERLSFTFAPTYGVGTHPMVPFTCHKCGFAMSPYQTSEVDSLCEFCCFSQQTEESDFPLLAGDPFYHHDVPKPPLQHEWPSEYSDSSSGHLTQPKYLISNVTNGADALERTPNAEDLRSPMKPTEAVAERKEAVHEGGLAVSSRHSHCWQALRDSFTGGHVPVNLLV